MDLAAIGIICVVMGHVGCFLLKRDSWVLLYLFHMTLFAYIPLLSVWRYNLPLKTISITEILGNYYDIGEDH